MSIVRIDSVGDVCPIPVVKTKKALQGGASEVVIAVDNEIAVTNLTKMSEGLGHSIESRRLEDGNYEVHIKQGDGNQLPSESGDNGNTVVVIGSDKMGDGAEDLGKALMKSFIYALSESETRPTTIIFYNSGARVTATGSTSLEDLKKLSENGVTIVTCGACINFYGLSETPEVGRVSNMYEIVELMNGARKIIRP